MTEEWKYNQNFKRHQKAMDFFRLSHFNIPPTDLVNPTEGPSDPSPLNTASPANTAHLYKDERGRVIVVPIWDMELPAGSQN